MGREREISKPKKTRVPVRLIRRGSRAINLRSAGGLPSGWLRGLMALTLVFLIGSTGSGGVVSETVLISEFQAVNGDTLIDEDGESSDWIEILNPTSLSINLKGLHLTDDPNDLGKWTFPDVSIPAYSYLLVFASGKDRRDPGGPLHTNFRIQGSGEFLALADSDGVGILHGFGEAFPPQFEDYSYGYATRGASISREPGYFAHPTPGGANDQGYANPGPAFLEMTQSLARPAAGLSVSEPGSRVRITARVVPTVASVDRVQLLYRVMYDAESEIEMSDDGTGADLEAGDGVYSVFMPFVGLEKGQMIRWRFVALDTAGLIQEQPEYLDPNDAPRYFGTVAMDEVQSNLPVFHWFVQRSASANTASGTKGSVYYLDRFYDNVHFDIHGQSTSGFPKKSYDVDFNRGDRFVWDPDQPALKDVNLLTNWADKTKLRNTLAYQYFRESGVPAHFAFPVRIQQNGVFFSVADFVEDGDDVYLERAGLDPEGVLYKMYNNLSEPRLHSIQGVEKKTRKEEANVDLREFLTGIHLLGTRLTAFVYDRIDLPMCVNFIAANSLVSNTDLHAKNYYLYHDINGTDEWTLLPWDLDLSWGRQWNQADNYFDDSIFVDRPILAGRGNYLVQLLTDMPEIRSMVLRRIRTLSDRFLQPPDTPLEDRIFENRIHELVELIDPLDVEESDADLDYRKWRSWGNRNDMRAEVGRLLTEYLPGRRDFVFNFSSGRRGLVPGAQSPHVALEFGSIELDPESGNRDEGYIEIVNPSPNAVDVSDWQLRGQVRFTFKPGTVLPMFGRLFVSPNVKAFRLRSHSPKGNEGLFVTGGYQAMTLNGNGELWLLDDEGREKAYVSLRSPRLPNYETWLAGAFSALQSMSLEDVAKSADPDGDGLINFLEYAFGTDPLVPNAVSVFESSLERLHDGMRFNLAFPIRETASDLSYTLEKSSDLIKWTVHLSDSEIRGFTGDSEVPGKKTLFFNAGSGVGERAFYRIKVAEK